MSKRRFGVEIEHGNRAGAADGLFDPVGGVRRGRAYEFVGDRLIQAGFDVSLGGLGLRNRHNYERSYSVGCDGSGVEVRTRILQGDEGFDELRRVFQVLNDAGGFISRADGMHIHISSEDYTDDDYARLAHTWVIQRANIAKLVAPHRNGQNAYNPDSWTRRAAERVATGQIRTLGRADLNYDHRARGHVEFRCHEGTLDYEKAANWIKFCQYLMDSVKRRKYPIGERRACHDLPRLLQEVHVPDETVQHCLKVAEMRAA